MSARYVVRLGKVARKGHFVCLCGNRACDQRGKLRDDVAFSEGVKKADALAIAKAVGGRIVPVLTHAEAKRKAAAVALREHAARCRAEVEPWRRMSDDRSARTWDEGYGIARGYEKAAEDADRAADALWARRVKP